MLRAASSRAFPKALLRMPRSRNLEHFEHPIDGVAGLDQTEMHLMITSLPGLLTALAVALRPAPGRAHGLRASQSTFAAYWAASYRIRRTYAV